MNYLITRLKYYIYRLQWHLACYFPHGRLIHVDIELTNKCNQKCVSCWHGEKKLPFNPASMTEKQINNILEQGATLGIKSVKFNLRGESLSHPYIVNAIKYAKELGYVDTMLNTNGVLLNERILNQLNLCLDTMIISVDSFWLKEYCEMHGCNKQHFFRLRTNLEMLKQMYLQGKLKIKVKLNYHVSKINEKCTLDDYYKNYSMFPILIKYIQKRRGKDTTLVQEIKARKRHCPHMKRRLTVLAAGQIYPCCVCYNEPLDILIGNGDLKKAWNSMLRKSLLENYKRGIYTDSCLNCTSADIYKS